MRSLVTLATIAFAFSCGLAGSLLSARGGDQPAKPPSFKISMDPGHLWRPPFGLDRIGRPVGIKVEAASPPEPANYFITAFSNGKAGPSFPVAFPALPPFGVRVTLERDADEVVLFRDRKPPDKPVELARQPIHFPDLEADAIARPDVVINPVDLGTILVPTGWLLLGPGQTATLETAAVSRTHDFPRARLSAHFESVPAVSSTNLPLQKGVRHCKGEASPGAAGPRSRYPLSRS